MLLDCGATSLTALRQQQTDPNQIEAVPVSHLHGDHFGGLPFLVLDGQFRRRTHDLTVIGPPGTRTRLEQRWRYALLDAADNVELFLCEGYSLAPVR